MTPPAWRLWKVEQQGHLHGSYNKRSSSTHSSPLLLLLRSTRRVNSRRKDLVRGFFDPSGWPLRCLSIALLLLLQAEAYYQSVAAAHPEELEAVALPTGNGPAQDEVARTEKSTSDIESASNDKLRAHSQQNAAAESTSDAGELLHSAIPTPITAENFFFYHRWGKNGNLTQADSGSTSTNKVDSSRSTNERAASGKPRRTHEEGKGSAGDAPPVSRSPLLAAPVGKTGTASKKRSVFAPKPKKAAPTAAQATQKAATARTETAKEAAAEIAAAAAAVARGRRSAASPAAEDFAFAGTATEAETARAAETAGAEGTSDGANKTKAAKPAGVAKAGHSSEKASSPQTLPRSAFQGVHEPVNSSRGGLRPRKGGELNTSLQDVAALAAAAAAAVAALNRGGLEFLDPLEEPEDNSLFGFPGAFRRPQTDKMEQPPLETVHKLAQMVQEAREDDLGIFDPVDSRGKKTIILKEWYTTTVASTMVGRRESDEDALLVGAPSAVRDDVRFKAVFDGHGGKKTSEYCADNVARYLGVLENFSFKAVKDACLRMDADVLKAFGPRNVAGSTGVIAIIEKLHAPLKVKAFGREIIPEDPTEAAAFVPVEMQLRQEERAEDPFAPPRYTMPSEHTVTLGPDAFLLTVVNIGDSRAMLFHEDGTFTRLSRDHKPNNAVEKARVEKAGGFVSNAANDVPRVDGVLALSRAFGDSDFKAQANLPPDQQRVVAVPDVRHFYVLPSDMLVMACDGVFEPFGMDWKYLHDVAVEELRASNDLERMISRMMDYAFTMNSHDNISVVATTFHKEKIAEPAVVYKSVGGTGEVIEEVKLLDGADAFSYAAINEGIFSLH